MVLSKNDLDLERGNIVHIEMLNNLGLLDLGTFKRKKIIVYPGCL